MGIRYGPNNFLSLIKIKKIKCYRARNVTNLLQKALENELNLGHETLVALECHIQLDLVCGEIMYL